MKFMWSSTKTTFFKSGETKLRSFCQRLENGISGVPMSFMSSFDNIPMSLFLRDAATDMLPIRMWQDLENRLDVTIAALSGVLILFTITAMVLMEKFIGLSRRMAS